MKRIIFFHLYNNYSGSPHVLSLILNDLVNKGYQIDLYTSKSDGFLSNITGVKYHRMYYKFLKNKVLTFILFVYSQLYFFISVLRYARKKDNIIYINTILPLGATLGASLIKKKVIYHIHEFPVKKNPINRLSLWIVNKYAWKVIFVSKYLYDSYNLSNSNKLLIYNSLSPNFTQKANHHSVKLNSPYTIMMACSLRIFKGILVFKDLAFHFPNYIFDLVLDANQKEISNFFKKYEMPQNLRIFSTQKDLHPFYSRANLVLNLSIPNLFIETFGLTALESMAYGIPVIIPPFGGIAELVNDGIQGYKVDSRNLENLIEKIQDIFKCEIKYHAMSNAAKLQANNFSLDKMINKIEKTISETSE